MGDLNIISSNELKIISYFDSYIINNRYIYIPEYIIKILETINENHIQDIINDINSIMESYIKKLRDVHRVKINNLTYNDYINLINNILYKINYLENTFSNYKNKYNYLLKKNSLCLFNIIITDPIIFTHIYNKIFTLSEQQHIIYIVKIVKNIQETIGNTHIYPFFINAIKKINMCNIHLKLNEIISPLPESLNNLNKLNMILKNLNYIHNLFSFDNSVENMKELIVNNIEILLNTIYDIVCDKDIDIINYIITNLYDQINKFTLYYSHNNSKILLLISNKILEITNTFTDSDYNNKLNILLSIQIFFQNYNHFKVKIKHTLSLYINEQDKLINFIDNNINNNRIPLLLIIIKMFQCYKKVDYDIFINKYTEKLTNRLIIYINLSPLEFKRKIENEKIVCDKLNIVIQDKICNKIKKVIDDTIFSYNLNSQINNKIKTITTSYNKWGINQTDGLISADMLYNYKSIICDKLKVYHVVFNKDNKDKTIVWLPHYGQIKCEYLRHTFIMLPIHYMILEQFDEITEHPLEYIYNLNILYNYSLTIKENIINTLVLSKLLLLNNNKLILSQDETVKYNTDIISLYLQFNNDKILEQNIDNDIICNRIEIINANINSILKLKTLTKEELYICLQDKIKLFTITSEIYDKSLEFMLTHEYIKLEHNNYFKIIY